MDIFFADDSIQRAARRNMGPVIAVGGMFVPEGSLRDLSDDVDRIAAGFQIPDGEELKWSPARDSWIHQNLHGEARQDCYIQVLQAALARGARAIVVCLDTARLRIPDEISRQNCLTYLFERVASDLRQRQSFAIVVADRPGGGRQEEETFLAEFLVRQQRGTEYAVPDRVLLNVLTTPSHLIRHLQVADLVTGITTAMVCGQYRFAKPIFPVIQQMLVRGNAGMINGCGLKIFPMEIVNVYHWVLEERAIVRQGGAIGWAIPTPHHIYFRDEFEEI